MFFSSWPSVPSFPDMGGGSGAELIPWRILVDVVTLAGISYAVVSPIRRRRRRDHGGGCCDAYNKNEGGMVKSLSSTSCSSGDGGSDGNNNDNNDDDNGGDGSKKESVVVRSSVGGDKMGKESAEKWKGEEESDVGDGRWNKNNNYTNAFVLLFSCCLTTLLTGEDRFSLTDRWTITVPLIPVLVLQLFVRRGLLLLADDKYEGGDERSSCGVVVRPVIILRYAVCLLSLALIVVSASLCCMFPPVQLPASDRYYGPYRVGMIDVFLPVTTADGDGDDNVPVRILYPAAAAADASERRGASSWWSSPPPPPYVPREIRREYYDETMKFGAPPPLKKFGWMLHTWNFIKLPRVVGFNADPVSTATTAGAEGGQRKREGASSSCPSSSSSSSSSALPMVVYSHGLGGHSLVYTYQTTALASRGYVVFSVNHRDGSSPSVLIANEKDDNENDDDKDDVTTATEVMTFDYEPGKLSRREGGYVESVRERRRRTAQRARDIIALTSTIHRLSSGVDRDTTTTDKESGILSGVKSQRVTLPRREWREDNDSAREVLAKLARSIDVGRTYYAGHSFGGATVLTAADERPDLVTAVTAHEPAVDWMPDRTRRSLFSPERTAGLQLQYHNGTGGYRNIDTDNEDDAASPPSLHDVPMMFLYSNEWYNKTWGACRFIEEMHQNGRLGPTTTTTGSSTCDNNDDDETSGAAAATTTETDAASRPARRATATATTTSEFRVIPHTHHSSFADTCMLTPLWLGRATGLTGKDDHPIESARVIAEITASFLQRHERKG